MMTVMYATVGLDGYHADAYASFLRELYDYDGKTFAWCCLGNIGGKHAESVVGLLAYATDRSAAETRRTLEALIP